jgi:hypothetical protein
MIKPVQRICKYPLLLKELINKTEPTHPEYATLKEAQAKIEDIVLSINEKKRDNEMIQKVYDISKSLSGNEEFNIITPTRKWIKEGEITFIDAKDSKSKDGSYFLFNDLFLLTKKKNNKNHIIIASPFDQLMLRDSTSGGKGQNELNVSKHWLFRRPIKLRVIQFGVPSESVWLSSRIF